MNITYIDCNLQFAFPIRQQYWSICLLSVTLSAITSTDLALLVSLYICLSACLIILRLVLSCKTRPIITCCFTHNPLWIVKLQASSSKGHGKLAAPFVD